MTDSTVQPATDEEIVAWCTSGDYPVRYPARTIIRLIARIDAERKRADAAVAEVEQCHAKSTCCCGDYLIDHAGAMDCGHSPVSMWTNDLVRMTKDRDALAERVTALEEALRRLLLVADGVPMTGIEAEGHAGHARALLAAAPKPAAEPDTGDAS